MSDKLVIIPTYKEKENIANIIKAIFDLDKNYHILIIDDNLHTGTDFLKLFRDVDKLINKLREEYSKPTEDEQKIINELEDIKNNPKFKTSQFLQSKYKELSKLRVKILERTEMITKNFTGPDKIFGYVLYELKSEDLKR